MNALRDENALICKTKGWDRASITNVWLLFTEEIGELASAIRHRNKMYRKAPRSVDTVENEMGDVFSYLFQLSYMLNVDLDKMWSDHKTKMHAKVYFPCNR
jgi:NTP pyrophosphatase (non-canonical NTP hydrolase)